MLGVIVTVLLSSVGFEHSWSAAMCFTGREQWYRQPRHYFSKCSTEPVDPVEFCAPYNVKFAMVTYLKSSRSQCEEVVRQNYPNPWRFHQQAAQPIVCDPNREGPPAPECAPLRAAPPEPEAAVTPVGR